MALLFGQGRYRKHKAKKARQAEARSAPGCEHDSGGARQSQFDAILNRAWPQQEAYLRSPEVRKVQPTYATLRRALQTIAKSAKTGHGHGLCARHRQFGEDEPTGLEPVHTKKILPG